MLLKSIVFIICMIGIACGCWTIYVRRVRVSWSDPGDPGYDDDAFLVTGLPAVAIGAATIALCLYLLKVHVL